MFGTHDLALFIVSGLLLNIAPGPDSLLIMTRSATQGWRAGSMAALGIGTGTMVHIFTAALGLSAVLTTSATAFTIVKLAGGAYLLYVGIGMLRGEKTKTTQETIQVPALPYWKIFVQGFLTNVLNPKVAVFFLAFVPQFISHDASDKALSFIVLGCIFNFNGMLWCNFLSVITALAKRKLKIGGGVSRWINRVIGGVFVSLGIKLALVEQA